MKGIVISYFDTYEGSKPLLTYPEPLLLTDDQMNQVNKLLDITFEKSFFIHHFDFCNTVNYYTEISSEFARGKKESLLVSILVDSYEDPENWKEPLGEFLNYIETIPNVYKGFYYWTTKRTLEVEAKFKELQHLTKNFYESIPKTVTIQRVIKIFMFGLDRAGKTSISKRISDNLYEETSPTLWLNVSNFHFQNFQFVCFDVGGQIQFRCFWKNYLHNSEILIYVLDGTQPERLSEAKMELWPILETCPTDLPLLILNNKADLKGHIENETIKSTLSLNQLNSPWHIVATSAKSGLGISEALDWISSQLMKKE